ncbi:biotin/lipoyl-binding protein [Siccirubricoccus deserti]
MRRRLMPLLSPALIAAMLALLSATAALAQQAGGGVPVTTDTVQQGAVPIEILANGIVASESVVTVRTRVDGQITQVHVTEGQMVRRGQPLFSSTPGSTRRSWRSRRPSWRVTGRRRRGPPRMPSATSRCGARASPPSSASSRPRPMRWPPPPPCGRPRR